MFRRWSAGVVFACLLSRDAAAEPRHAVYVDALGKGGLWGLGYDYHFMRRLAVGAVGSYYQLGGDRYATLSPYVGAYPVQRGAHAWFVHLGPQLVRRTTPSPVPEWQGMTTADYSAEVSSGYEYKHGILLRFYGLASLGTRFAPGLGVSLGWSL